MRKCFFLFLCYMMLHTAQSQAPYWQQQVDYVMDVTLNDGDKSLDGFQKITYFNHSPDTLTYIWFHIWPNAFKNDKTAFSEQQLRTGDTRFYFSYRDERGYINRLEFKVDGKPAKTEDHPQHIDIIRLLLPTPLLPGKSAAITTPFHVKLPRIFSRSGWEGDMYQVTQWYPKPAVYDARGWHEMPYLDQGEFYSEFGNYDVRITLPKEYVVAATGELQNGEEKIWMKMHVPQKNQAAPPRSNSKRTPAPKEISGETKTLQFKQSQAHDFAFFASKRFQVSSDTCLLSSGSVIEVNAFYTPEQQSIWKSALQLAKDALRFYTEQVGDYPYKTLSVVAGRGQPGEGMEYPGLALIAPVAKGQDLDITIAHEVGHNWFYGALGSDERAHPWLDEGLNTYFERAYTAARYPPRWSLEEIAFQGWARTKRDQPISTSSEALTPENYTLIAYHKAAMWMQLVEERLGRERFRTAIRDYYAKWKFKHPAPKDFLSSLAPHLAQTGDSTITLLDKKDVLPNQRLQGFSLLSPLHPRGVKTYLQAPSKSMALLSPALGFNRYDGLMLGALFSNYGLIPAPLQYLAVPLYGTRSGYLNGLGQVSYSIYPAKRFQKIEAAVSGLSFSKNRSLDSNGLKVHERFSKLSPSLRLTFKEPALSTRERRLEGRLYAIREKSFSSFVTKDDNLSYVAGSTTRTRLISHLTFSEHNSRSLYPYDYALQLQEAQGTYRVSFTSHYFFNYAGGGGAAVRLFGAKFGYLNPSASEDFSTRIYQPKLLAVTGEEDYTYSNYFVGRTASYANEGGATPNGGSAAQQVMIRAGGLKLRIDQYDFLQGRSEDWAGAINFSTTLPKAILPLPIPVKLFFDIGTYAEAWKKDPETSKFLYVGGLQLSLLKDTVHFYVPILYSKDFQTYLKTLPEQNKLAKKITFSVDLHRVKGKSFFGKYYPY